MSNQPRLTSKKLLAALDQAELAILLWQPDSDLCTAGGSLLHLISPTAENLSDWRQHIHPEDSPAFASLLKKIRAKQSTDLRCHLRLGSQASRWQGFCVDAHWQAKEILFRFAPIASPAPLTPNRDLPEGSKHALAKAKQQAKSASRSKDEFLANMSHEIRTPMNAVIGLAHLLLKSELSSKQREQVGRIQGAGKMLLGLINDILDYSKIEAGHMALEATPFKLDDCLDGLATVVLGQAQAKGLEVNYVLEPGVPPQLIGDPLRLTQVLVNLVGNALKFTAEGGVTLYVRVVQRQDEAIQLEMAVRDSGVGMSVEQQQNLFQAFTQADASITRKYGGTGLGLTICKRLVELMGGKIWLESEAGVGSTFVFTANFGISHAPPVEIPPARGHALIVDENTIASMVLSRFFQAAGYKVTVAASGQEALDILSGDGRYDCVTLDYLLPDLDGLAVAQIIRRRPGHPPHLVMITAADTSTLENAPGFSAFDEVLHKPVTAAHIQTLAQRLSGFISFQASDRRQLPRLIGMRILLAEDIPTNQFIAREILESFGVAVDIASNGHEVLAMIEQHYYDLILMDVQMPEMDGLEATRQIRSQPRWQKLPIVAMTAHAFDEERRRCLTAGMNDFLTKPIDPERLQSALIQWRPEIAAPPAPTDTPPLLATPVVDEIPDLPGIDTVEGLRRMMSKPKLYERVLRDFHQRFREEALQIEKSLTVDDYETALRRAHTIKGLAGSIGATTLQASALALENSIRQNALSLTADLNDFSTQLHQVIAGLAATYKL